MNSYRFRPGLTVASVLSAALDSIESMRIYFQIAWIWAFLTAGFALMFMLAFAFVAWELPALDISQWSRLERGLLLSDGLLCAAWVFNSLRGKAE